MKQNEEKLVLGPDGFIPEPTIEERKATVDRFIKHLRLQGVPELEIIRDANELRNQLAIPTEDIRAELVNPHSLDFPNVMASVAGEFAHTYSTYLEVPTHFLFMSFLTCLGSVLAERIRLATELETEPRLYTILLGESADDRKSTSLTKAVAFFKETLEHFAVSWGVGSAEGLQMRLKKDNNLLLAMDELKSFVNKCRIETSVLLPAVNQLFEMGIFETHTKHQHIMIKNARLSILAASTLQTYERIWTPAFTDIGFYNRLFLVPGTGRRKYSLPAKVPENEKQKVRNGLVDILKSVGERMELDLSQEAKDLYQEWYMSLEPSIHSKRLDTYTLRLMGLLAVNEFKDEIDKSIVEKAIALGNWQLEVRKMHDPVDAENKVAKLEERIRRALSNGPKQDWQLKQATHANREGLWFYGMATQNLIKFKEIAWDKKTRLWHLI